MGTISRIAIHILDSLQAACFGLISIWSAKLAEIPLALPVEYDVWGDNDEPYYIPKYNSSNFNKHY